MLVEMAIFDAYGAGFEFTSATYVGKYNDLSGYRRHPKWEEMKPGHYTDDTQMALALAELLLTPLETNEWSHYTVASAFTKTFRRDPREGYAGGFHQLLKRVTNPLGSPPPDQAGDFLVSIHPHSDKNGGAMRAGPIGLLPDPKEVVDRAMFQASLTHATRVGMASAAASALMVHYFHYRIGHKADLPVWLDCMVPGFDWIDPWKGRVLPPGPQAVRAALWAIVKSDNLADLLRLCVSYGGDTDTSAAIAGCAASRSEEILQFLPASLHTGLENGKYGLDYLAQIDLKLLDRFPPRKPYEDPEDSDLYDEEGGSLDLEAFFDAIE